MIQERNDLDMELLSKKEAKVRDLENSQPDHIAKKEVWPSGSLTRKLVWLWALDLVTAGSKLPVFTKQEADGRKWRKAVGFLGFLLEGTITIWLQMLYFKTRKEWLWRRFSDHQVWTFSFKWGHHCLAFTCSDSHQPKTQGQDYPKSWEYPKVSVQNSLIIEPKRISLNP